MWIKFIKIVKNNKVLLLFIAAALIALGSIVTNVVQYAGKQDEKRLIDDVLKKTENGQAKIEKQYQRKGQNHTVIKEVPVTSLEAKKVAVGNTYLDTVSKALKIAADKITELTKVNATLTAKVKLLEKEIVIGDSTINYIKTHKDKWLYAEYDPITDSLLLNYNVVLNAAKYKTTKGLLGPKQEYLDFYSDDPRVAINGVKRFSQDITPRKKKFGLGINASYSYNYFTRQFYPTIGLGVQYSLIRF